VTQGYVIVQGAQNAGCGEGRLQIKKKSLELRMYGNGHLKVVTGIEKD
jgi:hypothetical protein